MEKIELQEALKQFKPPFRNDGGRITDSVGTLMAVGWADDMLNTEDDYPIADYLAQCLNTAVEKEK